MEDGVLGGLLWFEAAGVTVAEAAWKGKISDEEIIRSKGLGSFEIFLVGSGCDFIRSKATGGVFSKSGELA